MKYLHFATLLLLPFISSAQAPKPYFQQEVNYRIVATLDDAKNTLQGEVEFEYVNNSADPLPQIWVHLWGNAFKNRRSAFCKQKLRDGDGKYYFSEPVDLGGYKNLDFHADGQKSAWKYDPQNPDIAIVELAKPLGPGARVRISTPFLLKIPASFSRLGHVETSYQMTQWYPKPAVYDHKGWHAIPYLDIGEFYSEFGSFDVTLTLPENYVVGATGVLQTPAEIEFLHKKELETREQIHRLQGMHDEKTAAHWDSFPPSSSKMKTIRYLASQVHDFAWFADKRFWVLKDTARLTSGKTVDCWAMFPPSRNPYLSNAQSRLWGKGAFYVRRAVEFYSSKVGEYPWPQATAVHSALSAGGGMEYPMITVIGNSSAGKELDDVITHEVGHNWFYGILASNERDHPFQDEGINTYYEQRYMREYYQQYRPYGLPKFILDEEKQGSLLENGYLLLAKDRQDVPPDTHSNAFSAISYGLQVYMKTAMCMHWLEQWLGTAQFDLIMQEYYRRWQFKHPYPEDLHAVFKDKGVHAKWFFETMQTRKQADYKLEGVKKASDGNWELTLERKGTLECPIPITALKNGKPIKTEWCDAFIVEEDTKSETCARKVKINAPEADAFEIDWSRQILDVNRKNNYRKISGVLPGMRPLEFRSIAILQNARRNTLAVFPWIGWNNYDKTMVGLMFYNAPMPLRKIQYYLLPGFGTSSKHLVGLAGIRYHFFAGAQNPKITLGVSGKMFDLDYNTEDDYYSRFWRVVPEIKAEWRSPSISFSQGLNFRTLFTAREDDLRSQDGVFLGKTWKHNTIYELQYFGDQKALPYPYRFKVSMETQQYRDAFERPANYLRSTLEWRQSLYYKNRRKADVRCFAGYFLQNTQRNRSIDATALSLNPQGFNDYKYDQLFLARTGADNILGRQVSQSLGGGFKGAFGQAFANTMGNSNNFILSLNLKADLPVRLPVGIPIKPYFDLGYFDDATPLGQDRPSSEQLLWSGGLMLEFFKGGLEIYFPLANSKTLKDLYCEQGGGTNRSAIFCGGNYLKMISWSMKLEFSDPLKMAENLAR